MAKFLDKKERVIDFQLTPYGKHRLSVGQLKPTYYAFFDTGVTYDSEYAGFSEVQTKIHERIKTETQFIEGILLFEEAENTVPESELIGEVTESLIHTHPFTGDYVFSSAGIEAVADTYRTDSYFGPLVAGLSTGEIFLDSPLADAFAAEGYKYSKSSVSLFDLDITPKKFVPKPNILSFESAIGNAAFEGKNTQYAPAWKLLACQGEITNVETKDTTNYNSTSAEFDNEIIEFNIPQIDVKANYTLEISQPSGVLAEEVPSDFVSETQQFVDGTTIKLIRNDVMVYAEELNTQLLTENFDVEVFEMIEDAGIVELKRKYFVDSIEQVVDGLMVAATEQQVKSPNITEDSVEYYFNILTDSDVSDKIACSCASTFNKDSYYIDIDFDCLEEDLKRVYYDIYGSATSPEICNPTSDASGLAGVETLLPETDVCEDE